MVRRATSTDAPEERPRVPCAHETCSLPARCRVQTITGWANFCEPHYVRYHDDLARKRFTELGLDRKLNETAAEHKARVMAHIKGRVKPKTFADADTLEDEWASA